MRQRIRSGLAAMMCAIGAACGGAGDAVAPNANSAMSPAARTYLVNALDVMETYSYYSRQIDWTTLRANALAAGEAARAQTTADTYPALRTALTALGDHHSFLQVPVAGSVAGASPSVAALHPADSLDGEIVGGRYGYLRVPTYAPLNGGTTAQSTAFADTLQALVEHADAARPCGWVVDLRHNSGGNMWPMLVGVGPILGETGNAGAFSDPNGARIAWFYAAGAAGTSFGGSLSVVARVSRPVYTLSASNPPVAVLTDGRTASSGEAIAIAFRGRAGSRSFGAATFGVPTANGGHPLSDGAVLWLMSALDVDRTGKPYIDPIPPDELIATTAAPATDDAVVAAATAWLAGQAACRN